MTRERRRNRGLSKCLSLEVIKTITNANSRREIILSLMRMGKVINDWKHSKNKKKIKSQSTDSDASGLSELEHRLEDFMYENMEHSRREYLPFMGRNISGIEFQCSHSPTKETVDAFGETLINRSRRHFTREPESYRNYNFYRSPYFDRKHVWIRPKEAESDIKSCITNNCVKQVPDSAKETKCYVKFEPKKEMLAKVSDNKIEILSLGWKWLKLTITFYNKVFYSIATIDDVETYEEIWNVIQKRLIFYVDSLNFPSDCISRASNSCELSEEIISFVVLIHYALIKHDQDSFKFLLGGIIGAMTYVFMIFDARCPYRPHMYIRTPRETRGGGDADNDGSVIIATSHNREILDFDSNSIVSPDLQGPGTSNTVTDPVAVFDATAGGASQRQLSP